MYRRASCWTGIAQNPKLQELDELASAVFLLLKPSIDEIQARLDARRRGLTVRDVVAALMPYLWDEKVVLHKLLGSTAVIEKGIGRLFAEAAEGRPAILFDTFREAITEAHIRHFERCAQRPVIRWRRSSTTIPLTDIQQVVPGSLGTFCLWDSDDTRCVSVLKPDTSLPEGNEAVRWTVDAALSTVVGGSLTSYTSAFAVVDTTKCPVFSQVDNNGATLVWLDVSGKKFLDSPLNSHATCMKWIPQLRRVACGSALGDVTTWTPNGRKDADTFVGHNGPVVALDYLDLTGLLATAGADGKIAIVDPPTMTGLRHVTADESFRCASFASSHNLFAAGGFTNNPLIGNSSLPPRMKLLPLEDAADPHEYVIVDLIFQRDQLASLDAKGVVKFWDLRTFRCVDTVSTATQRDCVMQKLFSTNGQEMVVSGSATRVLEVDVEVQQHSIVRADPLPIVSLGVLGATKLITASSNSVKLWNAKTGENVSRFSQFNPSRITAMTSFHETHTIFVGHEDGSVSRISVGPDSVECSSRHGCPVVELFAGSGVLVTFDARGSCLASFVDNMAECLVVESLSCRLARVVVPTFTSLCFTGLSQNGELIIFDLSDEQSTEKLTIDDVRQYDLQPAFRNGLPVHMSYALLQSLNLICIADGGDISIVSTHSGRSKRLLSWPVMGNEVVEIAFAHSMERPQLVSVEQDGSCVIYGMGHIMSQLRYKPDSFLDVGTFAPIATCAFSTIKPHLGLRCTRLVLHLSCVIVATNELSCTVFRLDGVHIGDLDMFRSGSTAWIPVQAGKKGGSSYRLKADLSIASDEPRVHCKHKLPMLADHPVLGETGGPARSSSPDRGGSPTRGSRPTSNLELYQLQDDAFHQQGEHSHFVVNVRCETSARTLQGIDIDQSKWTVDDEPEKKRDSKKTLVHMRLLTQEMNPSRALIAAANSRISAPLRPVLRSHHEVPAVPKRPQRLQPLRLPSSSDSHSQLASGPSDPRIVF